MKIDRFPTDMIFEFERNSNSKTHFNFETLEEAKNFTKKLDSSLD